VLQEGNRTGHASWTP